MKKSLIAASAAVLYVVLMGVTWSIGTRQAREKTEAMLDYAVNDIRITLNGAIDTMLEHLASMAVRHFKQAERRSMEEMAAVAEAFDIDELCIVDRSGRVIATNDPDSLGVDMNAKSETRPFSVLTNGVASVVSQPFRRHAYSDSRRKYLGVAFPGGNGYIQIGLDETRMARMIARQLSFLFDAEIGDTTSFLCANEATGELVSALRGEDSPKTLAAIGFDQNQIPKYVGRQRSAGASSYGRTASQLLFGQRVFYRSFSFGGHRFLVIEPESEFYGTRNMIAAAMAVLLALVLGGFAFSLARISGDAERIRAFYRAEDDARAKEMEIAKTIQRSALPAPLEASPHFQLAASMTPARDIGGDFYDFFMLDLTHLAFMVADVSGKGVTAALYMMTAKTLLKDAILATRDPADAFARVNAELCRSNTANMFLTAWSGVLDLESGRVTYANAGHNPPLKVADGKSYYVMDRSGPVLAFLEGAQYRSRTLSLQPGEGLFLYTDGVTEALDPSGALFGEERLADAVNAVQDPSPKSLCNVVRMAVAAFADDAPQADDLTVLSVWYVSRPQRFVRSFAPVKEGVASASAFLDECLGNTDQQSVLPVLHVILDEICSNIVKHSGATGFEVDIELMRDPSGVRLTFSDDGTPYNPLAHADPDTTLPAEERPIGGLGIMMVKRMSNSMHYERLHDRNFLAVVKHLPAPKTA